MAVEEKKNQKHTLTLDNRGLLTVNGVTDVESCDSNSAIIKTVMGVLIVKGTELSMGRLDIDEGILCLEGKIVMLEYKDGRRKKNGSLSALFK